MSYIKCFIYFIYLFNNLLNTFLLTVVLELVPIAVMDLETK